MDATPVAPPCPTCGADLSYAAGYWRCIGCGQAVIRPQPGPQEAFCASPADIIIYGGAAGGGKSWGLLFLAAKHIRTPGYGAVIFRRTSTQVTGAGSLWEESCGLYPMMGGRAREHRMEWRFPTEGADAIIQFAHLQHEKDKLGHQGKAHCRLLWDELTHFEESQFWYLLSRNRSTCGVRPQVLASTNPSPDSWVRRLIAWWIGEDGLPVPERDGKLRYFVRAGDELVWGDSPAEVVAQAPAFRQADVKSLTFIRSSLADNRILTSIDPGYRATLLSLPRVERERLLGGNWDIRAAAGDYFNRSWFEVIPEAPSKIRKRVRSWDLAATKVSSTNHDPDWTVGTKMSIDADNVIYIEHATRLREAPLGVERAYFNAATQDGKLCHPCFWQDPGQAGKTQIADIRKKLLGYTVEVERAARDKVTYALPVSSAAEARNIVLVSGPWVEPYLQCLEGFPTGAHDDDVDATSLGFLKLSASNIERLRRLARWR